MFYLFLCARLGKKAYSERRVAKCGRYVVHLRKVKTGGGQGRDAAMVEVYEYDDDSDGLLRLERRFRAQDASRLESTSSSVLVVCAYADGKDRVGARVNRDGVAVFDYHGSSGINWKELGRFSSRGRQLTWGC